MLETIDLIMQWLVAPMAVAIWIMFNKTNKTEKDVAVLQAQHESNKISHDREMKEMKETIKAIFNKLDSIEQTLRDK